MNIIAIFAGPVVACAFIVRFEKSHIDDGWSTNDGILLFRLVQCQWVLRKDFLHIGRAGRGSEERHDTLLRFQHR